MRIMIGAALVGGVLAFVGPAAISPATAASGKTQTAGTSDATDFSARRYHHRYYRHYGHYRPHYASYYYGRPAYYRPYPYYSPAPFTFGIGFGPFWW